MLFLSLFSLVTPFLDYPKNFLVVVVFGSWCILQL